MSSDESMPPAEDALVRPLAAYLAACGLPPVRAGTLARAAAKEAMAREISPAKALEELQSRIDRWAAPHGTWHREESAGHRAVRGRARILLAGLPSRWPELFLEPALPPEARKAIDDVPLHAMPDLHQTTSMVPQPLDLGPVSGMAEGTWLTFDKWPVLRGLTIWVLFFCMLGAVFYTLRY